MQTQIKCPNCSTPYVAEVHQVIDAKRNPELKRRLLGGQLNVAVCPNCGAGGQMGTAMVFHDPDHEMFLVYVPQELNLNQVQREETIGRLTRQVVDALPAEERRAYLLQPQPVLSIQTFLDKVLETEGITPEMIARQRKQAELLQTLIGADDDVADELIKQRVDEIDETFMAMLKTYIESASNANDNAQLIPMLNLQARLMTGTAVGRKLEKRQVALHRLNQEAKEAGGLSAELLLKHIVRNQQDMSLVENIALAGQQALTYQFFSLLTREIDDREKQGDKLEAKRLKEIRSNLVAMQEALREQSEKIMAGAQETLQSLLEASNLKEAVAANLERIDDAFMYYLSALIAEAEQKNNKERLQALHRIQEAIVDHIEGSVPPEIQLINRLVRADSQEERQKLIDENRQLATPELVQVVAAIEEQAQSSGQEDMSKRLGEVKALLEGLAV